MSFQESGPASLWPSFSPVVPTFLAAVVTVLGCGTNVQSGEAPVILTEQLPSALVGATYSEQLTSEGGAPPLVWSMDVTPPPLSWLQLDVNGRLFGTPREAVVPGSAFTVTLTDATGGVASRELLLEVHACEDGAIRACGISDGSACLLGAQRCEGGRFAPCAGGAPSGDAENCGPNCAGCGEAGDGCEGGRCRCGAGVACENASAASCCGGGCVDRQSDLDHCGECGRSCLDRDGDGVDDAPAGTAPMCAGGACSYACASGHARCDSESESCISIVDDVKNCGGCDTQCPTNLANTQNATCVDGVCGALCLAGFDDCNRNMGSDGCEISLNSDTNNCGACGKSCGRTNVNSSCSSGQCVFECKSGWANVNGDFTDGCEVNLMTNVNHCGEVGRKCVSGAYSSPVCSGGVCSLSCAAGRGNCNGNPVDGCEMDLEGSPFHCGACGNACSDDMVCQDYGCCKMEFRPGHAPICI